MEVYVCLFQDSFFFFLLITPAFAQYELDAIDVQGQKEVKDFSFGSFISIPTAELDKNPGPLLNSQLNGINGITYSQAGGPGSASSFFIRGTESRHVSYTLDGLKLNDASDPTRNFNSAYFTSPLLSHINIFKGPQAVLFGSDAFGGLVDMRTRKGEAAPETRLNLMGGSFGTAQASLGQDWKRDDHQGTLTWTEFRTDGISRLNKKRFNADERDKSESTQLTSSSSHKWHSAWETELLFSYLRAKNELDSSFTGDVSYDHDKNDQYLAQQKTQLSFNKNSSVSLRNGLSRHQRNFYSEYLGSRDKYVYDSDLIQNELLYRHTEGNLQTLVGLSTDHEDMKTTGLDKSFDLHGLFLQSAYRVSSLKFQAGGRVDKHSEYGNFYTGSSGVSYSRKLDTFSFQYSKGYKAPALFQLYDPFAPFGNPNLKPETNHSLEARWIRSSDVLEAEVALFQNRLSNLITYSWVDGYKNQARFIAEGVEFNGKLKSKQFEVRPGFTHQKFRENEGEVLRRPLNSFQTELAYLPIETSELSLKYRWYDSRKDSVSGVSYKLSSYEVWDLGARFMYEKFDFTLQLLNLLDREYEELYGYNVMPRSYFAGVGYKF